MKYFLFTTRIVSWIFSRNLYIAKNIISILKQTNTKFVCGLHNHVLHLTDLFEHFVLQGVLKCYFVCWTFYCPCVQNVAEKYDVTYIFLYSRIFRWIYKVFLQILKKKNRKCPFVFGHNVSIECFLSQHRAINNS